MPKQNGVTPFGDIIATPARGTFMVVDERPCPLWQDKLFPWSFERHDRPTSKFWNQAVEVLTRLLPLRLWHMNR